MYTKICDLINKPDDILIPNDPPLFDDFPGQRSSPMYLSAMAPPSEMGYFRQCTQAILGGMKTCCENQLGDFITGKFCEAPDKKTKGDVSGAPLHNLQSEQAF
ncbi:hypothetical protein SNE40_005102 [Patella caerulea]